MLRIGATVIITATWEENFYYRVGDRCKLMRQDSDGDWWASFWNRGNEEVYDISQCCIGTGLSLTKFEEVI